MAEDIRTMHEEDEDEVKYCERKRLLFFGLPWTFTKYTITPSMLTIDQGLLKTEENDCYMYKVQDVKLATTLLERIFGLGTITCYTGDVTNAELKLIHIRKSKEVKNYLLLWIHDLNLTERGCSQRSVRQPSIPAHSQDG